MARRRLSQKARQRRNIRLFCKIGFAAALLIGLCIGFVYVTSQESLRVQTISVSGVETIPESQVLSLVEAVIRPTGTMGMTHDSIFWYSEEDIVTALTRSFSQIESVSVSGFSNITLAVKERMGNDVFCHNKDCYLMTANGLAYKETTDLDTKVIYTNKEIDAIDLLPYQVFERTKINQLQETVTRLATLGIIVESVEYTNAILTVYQLQNGSRIVSRSEQNADYVVNLLREILPFDQFKYDFKTGLFSEDISYINIRYGDKIFFCKETEECSTNYLIN